LGTAADHEQAETAGKEPCQDTLHGRPLSMRCHASFCIA
jgi:hypothetical protein